MYGAVRNDFAAGNIHYEGHWKGSVLKIEIFLCPETATSEARAIWVQKSRDFQGWFVSDVPLGEGGGG